MTERVVVTGLGFATPLGTDPDALWDQMLAGVPGVTPPGRLGPDVPPTQAVGEVQGDVFDALRAREPELAERADRRTWFAVTAAEAPTLRPAATKNPVRVLPYI